MKEEGGGHLHLQFTIYYLRLRVEILRGVYPRAQRRAQNDNTIDSCFRRNDKDGEIASPSTSLRASGNSGLKALCTQNDRGISILQLVIYDYDLSLRLY